MPSRVVASQEEPEAHHLVPESLSRIYKLDEVNGVNKAGSSTSTAVAKLDACLDEEAEHLTPVGTTGPHGQASPNIR